MLRRSVLVRFYSLVLCSLSTVAVNADLVTYEMSGVGSGSVGMQTFADANFSMQISANPAGKSKLVWSFAYCQMSAKIFDSAMLIFPDFTIAEELVSLAENPFYGLTCGIQYQVCML